MQKTTVTILLALILAIPAGAQDAFYSIFSYDNYIPDAQVTHSAVDLQTDLYPEYYGVYSARADMRWAASNDSDLVAFWESKGDTILHILTELSGIEWREPTLDINLLRYFPSVGTGNPLIIPVGGMKQDAIVEAVPSGKNMQLNLIFQLARRMLDQTIQPRYGNDYGIAYHPLMRHGPYRRDNLAFLLAVTTSENVIGLDSARDARQSAFWRNHFPGLEIFERYFLKNWILTPDRTLADWLADEPFGSHLVAATRPPRRPDLSEQQPTQKFIEGLPIKGVLGMAVSLDDRGMLMIDALDPQRVAYAGGLRAGDRIRSVNGSRVRTHKGLIEKILETLYDGGATLQIMRDGDIQTVVLRPLPQLPSDEEQYYYEDYLTPPDSVPPDSVLEQQADPYQSDR